MSNHLVTICNHDAALALGQTFLTAQIIDLARNQTRVIQAGAAMLPMPNQ